MSFAELNNICDHNDMTNLSINKMQARDKNTRYTCNKCGLQVTKPIEIIKNSNPNCPHNHLVDDKIQFNDGTHRYKCYNCNKLIIKNLFNDTEDEEELTLGN
ncbi:MAG: hypothetical protein Edafosvirus6_18 [Edafosvirus sp.]|uniref:Uncharacterized protein n=1 Tax=Edafosvirus sp. TaxID=2487765 RepID=A0A3G4ZXM6_9VIRU|nr:MAG: hypothetical protein Edafosvirus6_18 [Edafosvirus sp.]